MARLTAVSPEGRLARALSLCGILAPRTHLWGLTSPLGTAFRRGQMVVREGVTLGSSPAGPCRAVPLPAGVGTGQGPAGGGG